MGNTCYMNSVISTLSNCIELTIYFLKGDYKNDINDKDPKIVEIIEEYNNIINQLWKEQIEVIKLNKFKSLIEEKNQIFKGNQQHDANEFLISLLNFLNEGLKAEPENKENEEIKEGENENDEEKSKKSWLSYNNLNESIITYLFCGQLKQILTCPDCGNSKTKFECFNIINLPIPQRAYDGEYIDDLMLMYVPKYGIRRPVKITFNKFRKDGTLKDIFEYLKKEDTFKYKTKIGKLVYNKTVKKMSEDFVDENMKLEEIKKEKTFYFCYDISNEEENLKIPVYLSEGGLLSDYPRILFLKEEGTLDDLRLKIYINIRKYILSPLKGEGIKVDELTEKIDKYIRDKSIEDNQIIEKITEEYKSCFKSENLEDNVKKFIDNLPFKIYLFNKTNINEKIIFSNNFIELSEEIKEKEKDNIKSFDNPIKNLLEKYCFLIEFDPNSEYINRNIYGELYLNVCTKCECNYSEKKENSDKLTLESCLENYIKEEILLKGEEWDCPKCNKKVCSKKKTELYYLPKILIICFTRFIKKNEIWSKNDDYIKFKVENMNMKDFMIGPDKEHSVYDLFGIIEHKGTMDNGHYISICKNSDNWYKYNDINVEKIDINDVQKSNAYILFYKRQTD